MNQLRLCLLFGGRSGEHEISVLSARSIYRAAQKTGMQVVGAGITRDGHWVFMGDCSEFLGGGAAVVTSDLGPACAILPDPSRKGLWVEGPGRLYNVPVDVVFPVLHGLYGEDGTVQGLLEMSGIPYVGAPPLASAICMDKGTTKRLLQTHGVPHVPGFTVERFAWRTKGSEVLKALSGLLKYPVFVKPSGSGSSLGVTKVKRAGAMPKALDTAFLYDTKALIEPSQEGLLEIECSVLGNDEPVASLAGQILPTREFYDYEAKYIDDTTQYAIPAPLSAELMKHVQETAVAAYKATGCRGMARVDFFVDIRAGEAYVNELNTIPGFTNISMYPKLWEASGLPFPALVERLVELALRRQADEEREVRRVE
ncbi:MAG: D-alanine--D-alanine ligase family protein [Bacillota bacterium]